MGLALCCASSKSCAVRLSSTRSWVVVSSKPFFFFGRPRITSACFT
ncbi:Uncharacterised protein [Mycobacterium tuberculosis]|nr:Uncharacterised protein [Mycobacterium tuberculosis]